MIYLYKLKNTDKGRKVRYNNGYKEEYGIITSWNGVYIFVKYNNTNYSVATSPKELTFI